MEGPRICMCYFAQKNMGEELIYVVKSAYDGILCDLITQNKYILKLEEEIKQLKKENSNERRRKVKGSRSQAV